MLEPGIVADQHAVRVAKLDCDVTANVVADQGLVP